jgi:ketosteroid isomerase-like protein
MHSLTQPRGYQAMSDLDDFRAFLDRQALAEAQLVVGQLEPRLALWSRREPISLLGAARSATGWEGVRRLFDWVARALAETPKVDFRFDVEVAEVSADGQMAYSVGFERFSERLGDGSTKPWTVRVTHVYRREEGTWKIVHRHGSTVPDERDIFPTSSAT